MTLPAGLRVQHHKGYGCDVLALWCPGCRTIHHVPVNRAHGISWQWDAATQTLAPSVRHYYTRPSDEGGGDVTTCHYHVVAGRINYCDDCPHPLRGSHALDTPPPDNYGGREYFGWGRT